MDGSYSKFFTFPNEYIRPQLFASYHKRHHGLLSWDHDATVVRSDDGTAHNVHDSFITHHWHLIQMTKEYSSVTPSSTTPPSTPSNSVKFPMRIFVNYTLDDPTQLAHIINYELWINPMEFKTYMQTYGTFPFEVYFTQLIRKMLSQCHEVPPCRSIGRVSDSEYKFLVDSVPKLNHWNEKYPLFKHEIESFYWMYRLEQSILKGTASIVINPLSIPILNTGYYYNRTCDLITYVKTDQPTNIPVRGGILADVTGSGKTAVALALIMSTVSSDSKSTSSDVHDKLMTPLESQFFFRSKATLIITPNNLSQQWLQEMNKFIQIKRLKIVFVTNLREFKKVKLADLLEADIVMTTDVFLTSKRYMDEVSYQARCLIRFPFVEHETSSIVNPLAWRIAVNKHKPEFENEGCVPLESIKWKRIIMDEIHMFYSTKNKPFPPLNGCFHWGLTGTPIFQNAHVMSNYVKFTCQHPPHWVPDFLVNYMEKCVHRFDGLELNTIERHLYLIDHTEREKQLLRCYDDIKPEKMIQLCSYFNLVDVDDMNQKIRLLTIDDIIKSVKKDKRSKIRDIESKIKYHDLAIRNVSNKIEESRQEMKKFKGKDLDDLIVIDVTFSDSVQPLNSPPLLVLDGPVHPNPTHDPTLRIDTQQSTSPQSTQPILVHDMRDVRDVIRGRKRRLERMVKRRDQLLQEKQTIERSIGFFESKVDDVKQQPLDSCPICMTQTANVITQCGHLFCRACIIKCLKKKYQCPLCKTSISPTDAHEIKVDSEETESETKDKVERVIRYGTKLTKVLELVQKIIAQKEKVVLFVQWTPLMNCIREMFRENKIEIGVMSGNVMQQNAALKKFKAHTTHVLMGSIDNTGLDLVNANHLIFVHALLGEEYVVKAMEDQAIARIHRNGQTKPVHVYWFISRGTIEEDIYLHTRCSN